MTQMRKGALEYCVLALLQGEERYGFELVQSLSQSDGLLVSEGTIYPLLSRLRREGLVVTEWRESNSGPPRKYYRLTDEGVAALEVFRHQWILFRRSVDAILKTGDAQ